MNELDLKLQTMEQRIERLEAQLLLKSQFRRLEKRVEDMNEAEKVIKIISDAANAFNVSRKDIMYGPRTDRIVKARHAAMTVVSEAFPNRTMKHVAKIFNRDHATIAHAAKSAQNRAETDKAFATKLTHLRERAK